MDTVVVLTHEDQMAMALMQAATTPGVEIPIPLIVVIAVILAAAAYIWMKIK